MLTVHLEASLVTFTQQMRPPMHIDLQGSGGSCFEALSYMSRCFIPNPTSNSGSPSQTVAYCLTPASDDSDEGYIRERRPCPLGAPRERCEGPQRSQVQRILLTSRVQKSLALELVAV